VNIRCTD